jgi:hypothetical protein
MKSYPKKAPASALGKQQQSHQLMFGETVQLDGGVPTTRKYTKDYKPGGSEPMGQMLPLGSLNAR